MTNMTQYVPLDVLKDMFDYNFIVANKINIIKLLRCITGEDLRGTKDFFEQVMVPALQNQNKEKTFEPAGFGDLSQPNPQNKMPLPPPMYLVGHSYKQRNRNTVLIIGVSNFNTEAETVYSMDGNGNVIHRYNRRDFGRVTGTDPNVPDPRNLELP